MKKLITLILILTVGALSVAPIITQAQTPNSKPIAVTFTGASNTTTKTTLTNTDTAVGVFKVLQYADVFTIQAVVTKVSGTVGGKVYLSGSLDGVNYDLLDSLTNANQTTNYKHFLVGVPKHYFYRLYYATSGSQVSTITASYLLKKQFNQ